MMKSTSRDRRAFLRSTAGALSAPLIALKAKGANDRISMAFIGVGVMGRENLQVAMAQRGVAVSAVCDVYQPHLERAGALARRSGHQPREVGDFRRVLEDRSIDAVCVSTPDHWHPYITVEACKAGKDVYVEKPAGVYVGEGRKMVAAARKYKRIVQAGTWQRSSTHFREACEIVRGGELGAISFCRTWIYSNMARNTLGSPADGAAPAGLNWDLWQGPARHRSFNPNRFGVYPDAYSYFRFFWDYAGGHLTDSGVHMIDILQMAFGEAMPRAVTALGGRYWVQDNTETPDTMQVTYEYPGFLASWEHRVNNTEAGKSRLMGLTFHGTRGTLYVDRAGFKLTPEPGSGLQPREAKRIDDGHPLHWENFLASVRSREKPQSDIETCYRSSAACILGNLAFRNHMCLDWDAERETVVQESVRAQLEPRYEAPWKLDAE